MKKIVTLLVCVATLCMSAISMAHTFTVLQSTQSQYGPFSRTDYIVQNGSVTLNRFGVERVVLRGLSRAPLQPVILEPSLGNSATEYTLGDNATGSDFENSIAASLAGGALDVYLYSPRESFLTPGQCSAPGSCSEAAGWGFAAVLSDLTFIQGLASQHDIAKPVIGGYSLGGITGTAAVNQSPVAFSGLILGDSPTVITDPTLRANYGVLCQIQRSLLASGQVLDGQLDPLAQTLVQLEVADPNGVTPIPIFPPGTTNRQAYLGFFTAPQPGPPASIFPPGFVLLTGSVPQNEFFIASEQRTNAEVLSFNFYIPTAIFVDTICTFAGDTTFTSSLGAFTGPVLSLEFEQGFGALDEGVLSVIGAHDSDIIRYPGYGHADALNSGSHRLVLDDVIIRWIYSDVLF